MRRTGWIVPVVLAGVHEIRRGVADDYDALGAIQEIGEAEIDLGEPLKILEMKPFGASHEITVSNGHRYVELLPDPHLAFIEVAVSDLPLALDHDAVQNRIEIAIPQGAPIAVKQQANAVEIAELDMVARPDENVFVEAAGSGKLGAHGDQEPVRKSRPVGCHGMTVQMDIDPGLDRERGALTDPDIPGDLDRTAAHGPDRVLFDGSPEIDGQGCYR